MATKTVSFKLSATHAEALRQMAEAEKRSRVRHMEFLIEQAWKAHTKPKTKPTAEEILAAWDEN